MFHRVGLYLAVYLAWVVVAIVGFWLIFQLRTNLLDVLAYTIEDPDSARDGWIARAIDRWFIMFAGGVWVFCVALLEGYFRNGILRQTLIDRLRKVVLIVVFVTVASLGLQVVL